MQVRFSNKIMEPQRWEKMKILSEEMVEKILSMVPFPYVFKARVLSKLWLARLSSISAQADEEKKRLAILFQQQVCKWSPNWKTFSPIPERTFCITNEEDLFAYDRTSRTWLRLPSLSFLPTNLFGGYRIIRIEGALLLLWNLSTSYKEVNSLLFLELVVANVLTRSWRKLPTRRWSSGAVFLNHTFEAYSVIQVSSLNGFLEIYDSTTATWTTMKLAPALKSFSSADHPELRLEAVGCVNGILYFLTMPTVLPRTYVRILNLKVIAVDINDQTSAEEINVVAEVDMTGKNVRGITPVFGNANLLLLFVSMYDNGDHQVVKINLRSWKWLGMAPAPPHISYLLGNFVNLSIASDGNCLFVDKNFQYDDVITYDLLEDRWGSFSAPFTGGQRSLDRWIPSSFQPGLNPFLAV